MKVFKYSLMALSLMLIGAFTPELSAKCRTSVGVNFNFDNRPRVYEVAPAPVPAPVAAPVYAAPVAPVPVVQPYPYYVAPQPYIAPQPAYYPCAQRVYVERVHHWRR